MTFYDLNVQWSSAKDQELPRTVSFLAELGYNTIALNHTISGKLPNDLTCAIPSPLPFNAPSNLNILRRCTLTLTDSASNHRINALAANYDILAVRPIDEKTLQHACGTVDCDLISLDLAQRLGYHFKFKTLSEAIKRGIRFEICYSQGLLSESAARRNLISNATQLIRAARGRGIVISSEARRAAGCRGPWDVVNLAAIWGLSQERGYEAVSREARSVVVNASIKRTSFRGVVDIVHGGEKPAPAEKQEKGKQGGVQDQNLKKRKAEMLGEADQEKPLSKREQKRRAKQARVGALGPGDTTDGTTTKDSTPAGETTDSAVGGARS